MMCRPAYAPERHHCDYLLAFLFDDAGHGAGKDIASGTNDHRHNDLGDDPTLFERHVCRTWVWLVLAHPVLTSFR